MMGVEMDALLDVGMEKSVNPEPVSHHALLIAPEKSVDLTDVLDPAVPAPLRMSVMKMANVSVFLIVRVKIVEIMDVGECAVRGLVDQDTPVKTECVLHHHANLTVPTRNVDQTDVVELVLQAVIAMRHVIRGHAYSKPAPLLILMKTER